MGKSINAKELIEKRFGKKETSYYIHLVFLSQINSHKITWHVGMAESENSSLNSSYFKAKSDVLFHQITPTSNTLKEPPKTS